MAESVLLLVVGIAAAAFVGVNAVARRRASRSDLRPAVTTARGVNPDAGSSIA